MHRVQSTGGGLELELELELVLATAAETMRQHAHIGGGKFLIPSSRRYCSRSRISSVCGEHQRDIRQADTEIIDPESSSVVHRKGEKLLIVFVAEPKEVDLHHDPWRGREEGGRSEAHVGISK